MEMVGADHLFKNSGHRFFYRAQKTTQNPSNTALIALHGFMGDHRTLSPSLSKISTCDVFYVDLPLFGNSDLPVEISTFYDYTRFLADRIKEISTNYTHIFIYGYSMGGRIGLNLLSHFPDIFSGAILESAQPGIESNEEKAKRRMLEQQWIDHISKDFDGFLTYWNNLGILKPSRSLSQEKKQLLASVQGNQNAEQLIRSLKITGTGKMPSLWENLHTIPAPLLLIAGEDDPKYTHIAQKMQTKLLDAETIIFIESGHRVHLDQPQKLAEKITQFIDQHNI
jgi:2-succinyl-6-hydroxy-2,4-cyclohexadiene-1-carboxylate synthase